MIKLVKRMLMCRRGRHVPDRRRARYVDDTPASGCENCGIKMKKHGARGWIVDPTQ